MNLWRRRNHPTPVVAPPAALVVRHLRKAIGAPGATAAAAGFALGVVVALVLAAALMMAARSDE